MYVRRFFTFVCLSLLLTACGGNTTTSTDGEFLKLSTDQSVDQQASNHAKDLLSEHEEITIIHAVNSSKDMIIAIEVHHHDRFKLKKIKKRLQKEIDKEFPNFDIIVSTDKKIILEVRWLEEKINKGSTSKEKINKKVKEIIKSAKDQT